MSELEATISLDPGDFRAFILGRKKSYEAVGSYVSVIVLGDEAEELITHAFFQGQLSDLVTYNTDRQGKIRMYLAGVKTMFSSKIDAYHSLWVLGSDVPPLPNPVVTPPAGPGSFPTGGTPGAVRVTEYAKAA